MSDLQARIGQRLWLAAYDLAESRDLHTAYGRHLRAAACSIGLALLVLVRGGS